MKNEDVIEIVEDAIRVEQDEEVKDELLLIRHYLSTAEYLKLVGFMYAKGDFDKKTFLSTTQKAMEKAEEKDINFEKSLKDG